MSETLLGERSHRELGLSDDQAVELYRLMVTTRAIDDRIWALNRQGRVGITAPCRGHEAAQLHPVMKVRPDRVEAAEQEDREQLVEDPAGERSLMESESR